MSTLARFLEALIDLQRETAPASLRPNDSQKTEFHYGFVCGVQVGLKRAEELLNQHLNEVEEDGDGKGRTRTNRAR